MIRWKNKKICVCVREVDLLPCSSVLFGWVPHFSFPPLFNYGRSLLSFRLAKFFSCLILQHHASLNLWFGKAVMAVCLLSLYLSLSDAKRPSWAGAVCTGVFSLRPLGILAVPSIPLHFLDLLWCSGVTGWATDFSTSDFHFGANSSSFLCGLAVLHYIEMKNVWVDSEVGFLHAPFRFRLYVSRGFTKTWVLGWLSCLRSPTFRHLYIVTRVSQDFTASVVYRYVILYVIGASFSLIECASCHRYLEPNGFSAPILLSFVHHWWLDSGTALSSLTHSSSEDYFVFEFVWLIRFIVLANDRECFCCFSRTGIVLFALL